MILDHIDHEIINQLQEDLPLLPCPYAFLAKQIGISETEYLIRLGQLKTNGVLRRVATVLRHRETGYKVNAMLVWKQNEPTADLVGAKLAELPWITHLYLRAGDEIWPYNMYAMVHARSEDEMSRLTSEIRALTGNPDIRVVKSVHEYKKVSMHFDFKERG